MTRPLDGNLTDYLSPARAALLVIDVQNDFVHEQGKAASLGADLRDAQLAVEKINSLIDGAHVARIPVFYLRTEHSLSTDSPNYIARYGTRGFDADDLLCSPGTWGAGFYDGLTPPSDGDEVVTKYGYDGFQDTSLDDLLRTKRRTSLILAGVVTNLCVQTTAEHGFGLGYFITIVGDATAGDDAPSHEAALRNLETYFGRVMDVVEIIAEWSSHKAESAGSGGTSK